MSNKIMIKKFLQPVGIFVLAFGLCLATRPVVSFAGAANGLIKGSRGQARFHKPNRKHRTKTVIYVGPTASGNALDLLDIDFNLVHLDDSADTQELGHLLVGPDELNDARFVVLLKEAYAAGYTVGITESGDKDVQRLQQALGLSQGFGSTDGSLVPFVGMQKGGNRYQTYRYTYVMLPRQDVANTQVTWRNILPADYKARQWLRQRFADSALPPLTDSSSCTDPQNCLIKLANSTTYNWIQQDSAGDSIEFNISIWGTRSFMNSLDYYYVEEGVQYYVHNGADALIWSNVASNNLLDPNIVPPTDQPSPGSTSCSTSTTTGVSYSFGGNAGFSTSDGFDVTPVSVGMDISNSTTTTCPSTQITYEGDPAEGTTKWDYDLTQNNVTHSNETFLITNHWIWEIGFDQYLPGQESIQFQSAGTMLYSPAIGSPTTMNLNAINAIPLPFDTFTLSEPTVTGVNPTSVEQQHSFDILGSGLYPSLVTAVQLGGVSLPTGNYSPSSDSDVTVTVPGTFDTGQQTVGVQTSQGQSNTDVTVKVTKNP